MTPAVKSLILGGVVLAISALVQWVAIPVGISVPGRLPIAADSPAFWPRVITIGMIVLGALEFGHGLILSRRAARIAARADRGKAEDFVSKVDPLHYPLRIAALRVAAAMALMLAYYYAVQWLGMLVASALATILFAALYGERRLRLLLPVAILLPVALYYFFVSLAHVPLPRGVFG